jgi:SAM-dependent methyltransferase
MSTEWESIEYALQYLSKADQIPHRTEGESALLEEIPPQAKRILDIGAGDGRLLDLCLLKCPHARGVALDFSPPMLEKLRVKYDEEKRVKVINHDIDCPLPSLLGRFDVIVSSFSIHHVDDQRKNELYKEIWQILDDDGVFCNLEHVSSPTHTLHEKFFLAMGMTLADEDKSNRLLDVETQLRFLREIGFTEVDCYWKWRELALLIGKKV